MKLSPQQLADLSPQEKRALLAQLLRNKTATPQMPLSFAQQRLWFFDQLAPGCPAYNAPLALRLTGPLDVAAMEQSLNALVQRHAVLRTTLVAGASGEPVQVVAPTLTVPLHRIEVSASESCSAAVEVRRLAIEEARRPFELTRGPLVRATLYQLGTEDHVLLLMLHHIVSDGWSLGVVLRDVAAFYEAALTGAVAAVPELPIQYADFAAWQRQWMQGEVRAEQLAYWKKQLAAIPAALDLPTDRPRPAIQTFRGALFPFELSVELSQAVRVLSTRTECTPFMILFAAFQTLLLRYTGQEDLCIGTPIANRQRAEIENLVGFFVNTLILRGDLSGDPTFRELLQRVRETALGAYAHQDLPFEKLVEELQPQREMSRSPLFQILFVFQNAPLPALELRGLKLAPWEIDTGTAKFDLSLFLVDGAAALRGTLEYNTDLFDLSTAERLVQHWCELLAGAVAAPDCPVSRLPLLTGAERRLILEEFNATATTYTLPHLLHHLVAQQVERTPDAVAVRFEGQELTYRTMDQAANRLAHWLRRHGIGADVPVGVCMERAPELVVALLACLKAGGAYLPLDPDYPLPRLALMLDDARPPVILTQSHLRDRLQASEAKILSVDEAACELARENDHEPALDLHPSRVAYVIYTSGSTGVPKGALNSHRGICNRLLWMQEQYRLTAADRVLQKTPYSFDVSVWEFFWPLLTGARLVLARPGGHRDPAYLADLIEREQISVCHFVPSMLQAFLQQEGLERSGVSLRDVMCSGEALPRELAERFLARLPARLHNLYGPTEAAVDVTFWECKAGETGPVPIGRPVANTRMYVLDRHRQPLPAGIPGELYIGGVQVAHGYLNRPELTDERFVPDPFATDPIARLYRTGDLGRWRADGALEYLGRLDHQVKIRGNRIELGEIETVLGQHPNVDQAVVMARIDTPGDLRLVAYVVASETLKDTSAVAPSAEAQVEQVGRWQTVWDDAYHQTDVPADPHFNTVGWNSSYTGLPIPKEEMLEWVEHTVARILSLRPARVLEIGCGTGLLLFRVAPHCQAYTGLDFSRAALRRLEPHVQHPDLAHVTLVHGAADQLERIGEERFDVIVLNSVIQYFPSVHYVVRVLEAAVLRLNAGGTIFLGDLRNLRLLEAFHASVQFHKAPAALTRSQLVARMRKHVAHERELLIDPAFFTALQIHLPQIAAVQIQLKRGSHRNELTNFRYDVCLHVGKAHTVAEGAVLDWEERGLTHSAVQQLLGETAPPHLHLTQIPNSRLCAASQILDWLAGASEPAAVGGLRDTLSASPEASAIDPECFWKLGQECGYQVEIRWAESGDDRRYDVIFYKDAPIAMPPSANIQVQKFAPPAPPWSVFANDPSRGQRAQQLPALLRSFLQERLPEYMVPSALVVLDALPLSANGKVDRKELPAPERTREGLDEPFMPPQTPAEKTLARLWSEVLGVDQVGTRDNFFELGGHSLLATQLISRMRPVLQVELPLRALFETPTVAGLALRVEEMRQAKLGLPAAPLHAIPRQGELPVSFGQETFWFLDQLDPGSPVFNIDVAVRLRGPLNNEAARQALQEVLRRHEALRTTFQAVNGRPVAVIAPVAPAPLPLVDLGDVPAQEREDRARRLADEESRRAFDLARGPLFRSSLLRLGPDDHVGLLTVHHSVFDGWSMGVFLQEMGLMYRAFTEGSPSALPELSIHYVDFAHWQRRWLQSGLMDEQLQFWKKQLAGCTPVLELPADHPRPAVRSFRGARALTMVPPPLTRALHALSRREGCTLFMTLLAGFQALLARYTGQDDLCIGTPIAGRNRAETEGLIGFFVNTLVLRTDLSGGPTFRTLMARARETALGAYAHQDLPFEMLVQKLRPARELSHSTFFQVMFILQNAPLKIPSIGGLTTGPLTELADNGTSKFDLTLTLMEGTEGLSATAEYNTDLFRASTISRLLGHYLTLLETAVADPDCPVATLSLLTAAECQQLDNWNRTTTAYPADKGIHDLFAAQAALTPDAEAVVSGDVRLTYRELNRRADLLAQHLRGLGVGPEVLVGLYLERSADLVVALLSILKAGGAYVPLDPSYPGERLGAILDDAGFTVILTQQSLTGDLSPGRARLVCVDASLPSPTASAPVPEVNPEHLAYVIYTSGTTGRPKGVMLSHAGLCNASRAWEEAYQLRAHAARHLQMASCAFDVFTGDWVRALCSGGTLILCPRELLFEPQRLYELMVRERVNCAEFVPAVLRNLVQFLEETGQSLDFMRLLVAGSDMWYVGEYRKLLRLCGPQTRLVNSYGLTEATIDSTYFETRNLDLADDRPVPIGRPFANTQIRLLDRQMQQVPVGVPGELHIGGVGLARGYFNQPELTAQKFILDPFPSRPGARLFRTGDLARYLPDGSIELLGRTDHQVKLRGFRIELGEIESVLAQHPAVRQALVVARNDARGEKHLVAYLTASDETLTTQELRGFLQPRLPDYMVPAAFVVLDAFPLTPNGKLDRQALPEPEMPRLELQADFVAPRTPVEEVLAGIWSAVLGLEKVGVQHNFFELGGHSLLATQIMSRLHTAFQVEVPLRRLFEQPTIAGLAESVEIALRAGLGLQSPPLQMSARDGAMPLSFAQQRLWFLDQFEPDSAFYNIPLAVRLAGRLNVAALERSMHAIVARHEVLRTTFRADKGQPVQVIAPELRIPLHVVDLEPLAPDERAREVQRLAQEEAQRPFRLEQGPLMRVTLLRLDEREHVSLLTMHHIISDGWSMGIFLRELTILYRAEVVGQLAMLPILPVQYVDFARWQRQWLRDAILDRQLAYWKERLAGAPAALELPTDHPRPAAQSFRGSLLTFQFSSELNQGLEKISQTEGATLFMTLLAAFQMLLARYTGQEDISVGTPIAGRNRAEIEGLIGFFVNTLVMRTDLSGNPTFRELLTRVRETALGAYAHQDLPFEKLVEELQPQRDLSRSPLFQVLFILQNVPLSVMELPDLQLSPLERDSGTAKFDMTLALTSGAHGLHGSLEFNTDLFEAHTMRRLLEHFRLLLESIVAKPDQRLGELPLLTPAERRQVLIEWNRTQAEYSRDLSVSQLFEAQVQRTPAAIALTVQDQELTYAELNRRANLLAYSLRDLGVGPEVPVALCIERSVEMVVALLGILKAGGAYLPLDPAYPHERIAFMLSDSRAPILLTQQHLAADMPTTDARMVCLDRDGDIQARMPQDNPGNGSKPENLAYILYTSGSTGQPKGVQITQRALVNFLESMRREPGLNDRDVLLAVTTLSFDIAGLELFLPLIVGARVVVVAREAAMDGSRLIEELTNSAATVLQATPATWRLLLEAGWTGNRNLKMLCGGESLPRELARRLHSCAASVWNMYGPTETTIWSSLHRVEDRDGSVPIGRPIANTQMYVLDDQRQPVPVGVVGELYIGGAGVARGYLNRPELTTERFVPDSLSGVRGARLYRTGDLARWRVDGELECLGRVDHQVKVRGFRIELGEIETALARHAGVAQAVVTAGADAPGDMRLAAYIVPKSSESAVARAEQIMHWQGVWDETYLQSELGTDTAFNLSGWNSSYTGQPIPEAEMREWRDHTVARILALQPRRVLEIGCGTGLLLGRIAPQCELYVGTDFSASALRSLQEQIRAMSQVTLLERQADNFDDLEAGCFDVVVLNSIVQYFSGIDYLWKVLGGAVKVVKPGGSIFLGDLRSLPLLKAFHAGVLLHQASPSLPLHRLQERVRNQVSHELELLLDPALFVSLRQHLPAIRQAQVHLKRGQYHNELTRFRYDAILHVNSVPAPAVDPHWLDFRQMEGSLSAIRSLLMDGEPEILAITGIPNARVADSVRALELLASPSPRATVADLQEALHQRNKEPGIDPEEFWAMAKDLPYTVEVSWLCSGGAGRYEVVFRRKAADGQPRFASPLLPPLGTEFTQPLSHYANDPLHGKYLRALVPQLRVRLQQQLPSYMVPSAFVLLESLPLTPNGKVDRRALPAPDRGAEDVENAFVAPATPIEETIAEIWAAVLGRERVGTKDNFFELGGHSLLATQVLSRVRDAFHVQLPLRRLFEQPTVAGLAQALASFGAGQGEAEVPPLILKKRPENIPLSFIQERLWFLDQFEPDHAVYHIPLALGLVGPLKLEALEHSLNQVVARHEMLRTTFESRHGQPLQVIAPALTLAVTRIDLQGLPTAARAEEVRRRALEWARRPFRLDTGPLLRCGLLHLAPEEHVVLLTLHHIIADGWSLGILLRELTALYRADTTGQTIALPTLPVQYADYAIWQRQWLQGEMLQRQLRYWKERLAGAPASLDLPADHPRPAVQTFRGSTLALHLPRKLAEKLHAMSQSEGATLFMTLLAAFQTLLARYTGQEDISVGTPIAGRNRAEIEGLVGCFINTLVMRTDLSGDPTFRGLLIRVRETALGAYAHQDLPFEKLVEELQPQRDLSRSPLFQVLFILQNTPLPPLQLLGLRVSLLEETGAAALVNRPVDGIAKFDLTLALAETEFGLQGELEFNTDLFEPATIARLAGHFRTLLEGIVADPEAPLSELPLLTPAECQELARWNETATIYSQPHLLTHLLREVWLKTPQAVAVAFEGREISYDELHRRANQLAHRLQQLGAGPDRLVAVCMERSPEMVVALVGILKAGAAYVPLDPDYPAQRLAFMLQDAQAPVLLTQEHLRDRLPPHHAQVLYLEPSGQTLAAMPETEPENGLHPEHLAYVIYTSGSTGQPKGAMNTHQGICNRLLWMQAEYRLTATDRVLQKTPFSFDVSVWEFFWPLLTGARLVLASPGGHRDGAYLVDVIARERITVCHFVPSMLQAFLQEPAAPHCTSLRDVICSGEALPFELQQRFYTALPARLHNLYGPTEASVDVSFWECPRNHRRGPVPIGRPIANIQLHVLDTHLRPVPVGVPGELYIGGIGLARGYWNRPELTAARFLADPFRKAEGARLYRTGDRARWRAEGVLEYLGRLDGQVKIRGFRIETEEIENALCQHPAVREAAIVARDDHAGDLRLVGYLVPQDGSQPTPAELRRHLKERLPEYMLPAAFVLLGALPLSPNGKLDRRALPAPEASRPDLADAFVPPGTEMEKSLAEIWTSILKLDRAGIHDNFFDLGGHSLALIRVMSQLRERLHVDLPLRDFFERPTIAELARWIENPGRTIVSRPDTILVSALRAEATLDPTIDPRTARPALQNTPERLFLTGATGFLGAFLLRDLLQQTGAEIHCLVRAGSVDEGMKKLRRNMEGFALWEENLRTRIIPIVGDLAQPLLGLPRDQFDALATQIDSIYHNGALVNFVAPYEQLKPANVLGTQEVLRLACQERIKPMHYISSVSVFDLANRANAAILNEDESLDQQGSLTGGYAQSKWVAEMLVVQAQKRGLPLTIHRPGRIIGAGETGIWNTDDFMCGLIKACVERGMAPDLDPTIEVVPVDYVSRAAIVLSRQPASAGKVFHLVNPHAGRLSELFEGIKAFGYPLRQVPYALWYEEVKQHGGAALESILLNFLPHPTMVPANLEAQPSATRFDCRNTLAGLQGTDTTCPPLTRDLVGRFLAHFVRSGFLQAPDAHELLEYKDD